SINRAAKADRAARLPEGATQTRTVSVRLYGLADTSVVVRIPVAREARNAPSVPVVTRSGDRKSGARKLTVACEPVVSVLTEIAKRLEPGRGVTKRVGALCRSFVVGMARTVAARQKSQDQSADGQNRDQPLDANGPDHLQ